MLFVVARIFLSQRACGFSKQDGAFPLIDPGARRAAAAAADAGGNGSGKNCAPRAILQNHILGKSVNSD